MPAKLFDRKLFFLLSIAFIAATIIGTVSHEYGHYIAARCLGYTARVGYGYTDWTDTEQIAFLNTSYRNYSKQIKADQDFPDKAKFIAINNQHRKDDFLVRIGGPLETMLVGTIGLILLFIKRRSFGGAKSLSFIQWVLIFMSLFWLRQPANMFTWLVGFLIKGRFSHRGDEVQLAWHLGLPIESIATITALIGAVVLYLVYRKFIPSTQRTTFLLAGLTGGVIGYVLWLYIAGPVLMP